MHFPRACAAEASVAIPPSGPPIVLVVGLDFVSLSLTKDYSTLRETPTGVILGKNERLIFGMIGFLKKCGSGRAQG
jgi:hypothetical protein